MIIMLQQKNLTEKRYDAAIVDAGATPGIRVIDPAMLESNVPIKPRKMLIYFLAFCTSIFFPISITFILFLMTL